MKSNNKAITSLQALALIAVIVIVIVIAAVVVGSSPATTTPEQPVTVYLDSVDQAVNFTEPQTLNWGAVQAGNTYTKNLTVISKTDQVLTLKLYTTEPAGTQQTWAKNNTALAPSGITQATLVLILSDTAETGAYTWRLLAVNGTVQPTPSPEATSTPAPTPTPTPEPNTLQYTIACDAGIKNVTITVNSKTPFTILADSLPKTILFTVGDKIKFQAALEDDYTWLYWEFADGTSPSAENPLTVTRAGNFTIMATTTFSQ